MSVQPADTIFELVGPTRPSTGYSRTKQRRHPANQSRAALAYLMLTSSEIRLPQMSLPNPPYFRCRDDVCPNQFPRPHRSRRANYRYLS